ncbi:MAG TPA: TolC family protein, partial [Candidatus Paceibacterota bacterium]|nr:TolC family protein [Candidatus Paceibacterota bacterium]
MKRLQFCGLPLVLAVALAGASALPARSQESVAPGSNILTLDDAVWLALTNNPEIRVLAADIAAACGEVITARTWQNPEISVAPGFKTVRDTSATEFHGDFGLEQTFEWPGRRALRRAVAEKDVAMRQLALDGFRAQLAIQVRRACSTLLASREVVALREQRLALARSFVDAARKRAEGGFAPEFEVTKAEVEAVAAQKSVREARAQQDAARVALNTLMGRQPAEQILVRGALSTEVALPRQSELLERALAQNPAVKVQEAGAARAGLNLQSIRKSRLPDFKIGPSLEYTRDEQIVGLGVTLPLPFWDKKKGEITTATAEQDKALAELEKLRADILRD